jgi:hypothetical protein
VGSSVDVGVADVSGGGDTEEEVGSGEAEELPMVLVVDCKVSLMVVVSELVDAEDVMDDVFADAEEV